MDTLEPILSYNIVEKEKGGIGMNVYVRSTGIIQEQKIKG